MIFDRLKYVLLFFGVILLQGLVLNNVAQSTYVSPYFYIYFILLLPVNWNPVIVLVLSFILGLFMDVFTGTIGMHAAACGFAAYSRYHVIKYLSPRGGYEGIDSPTIQNLGVGMFLTYISIVVFLHHFTLFYIEVFKWSQFFRTFLRVIASTLFTIILLFITQMVFEKKTNK